MMHTLYVTMCIMYVIFIQNLYFRDHIKYDDVHGIHDDIYILSG